MRCFGFGSSAAVSPTTEPPQPSSCSKEKVCKVGLSALFGLAGTALNGMGAYAYTQEEQEYGSALVMGGVLCYTAVVVVVYCVPLTGLVKVVNKLSAVVTGAKKVEEDLEKQNIDLSNITGRLEDLTETERKIVTAYQAQINQIKKEREEIQLLLATAEITNQQLLKIINQFQTVLSSIPGIDKENKELENLIATFNEQIAKVGELSSEADETAGHADRLDQENAELVKTTEQLSSLVKNIADSFTRKQQQLDAFDKKVTALNQMDEMLLNRVSEIEQARKELDAIRIAIVREQQILAQLNKQATDLISQLNQMGYAGYTLIVPPP